MKERSTQQIVQAVLQRSLTPVNTATLLEAVEGKVTDRTLRRWLVRWMDEGLVKRTGQKRGTRYQWIAPPPPNQFQFLNAVPSHRRSAVIAQIRDLWTHTSTSIEGNALTLGDTFNILEYGLTISGKPLKEHQEIIGHARAIDQIYALVNSNQPVTKEDLFELHKSVQTERIMDIHKPVGGWKIEPNGCNAVDAADRPTYIEYAAPAHVDVLMEEFLQTLNKPFSQEISIEQAIAVYARLHIGFVHIHPFWDGNGRLARLVANIPLLKAGLPPLMIDQARRAEYIRSLSTYQIETGRLTPEAGVWPVVVGYEPFVQLCTDCYRMTHEIIEQARS